MGLPGLCHRPLPIARGMQTTPPSIEGVHTHRASPPKNTHTAQRSKHVPALRKNTTLQRTNTVLTKFSSKQCHQNTYTQLPGPKHPHQSVELCFALFREISWTNLGSLIQTLQWQRAVEGAVFLALSSIYSHGHKCWTWTTFLPQFTLKKLTRGQTLS